jgi:hypothetical protein
LCKQIEREVLRDDWKSGGRSVGDQEFYEPGEEEVHDHGGWTGGDFVLGGSSAGESVVGGASGQVSAENLSRREIIARAAEERMKKTKRAEEEAEGSGSAS